MDEDLIQQEYYLNVDVGLVGAYYSKQLDFARQEGRVTSVPYDPNYPVETWRDLGVADDTAIVFTQSIGDRVHVIDCLEMSGEGLAYYVHELRNRGYQYDRYESHHAPPDIAVTEWGTGKTRLEQAEEHGISLTSWRSSRAKTASTQRGNSSTSSCSTPRSARRS